MRSGWDGRREQQTTPRWCKVWVASMLLVVGAFGLQALVPEEGHVPHHEVISVPLRRETLNSDEESTFHHQAFRHFKAIEHATRRYPNQDIPTSASSSVEDEFYGFLNLLAINNHIRRTPQELPTATAEAIVPGGGGSPRVGTGVLSAISPKTASSLGIDQDGLDFLYFAFIEFGPNRQRFKLVIDTGSSYTWIPSTSCSSPSCQFMKSYGTSTSSSLKVSNKPFSVIYGGGAVLGNVGTDTMRFAGFEIVSEFGLVRTVSDDFMNFTIDGILGLGPEPADSTTSYMDMDTVMDTLAKQGAIQKKMYGVALARASDPVNDGVLNFGGVDPSMYEGEVMFSNIVAGSTLWHIILEGAKVLGKDLELGGGRSAVIDTGTSLLFAPVQDAIRIHAAIPNAQIVGNTFIVPCDTPASLSLTFNNVSYSVPPADYVGPPISDGSNLCISLLTGRDLLGPGIWLLGDVFLKNVYSVFDLELSRVGFANRKRPAGKPKPFTRTAWTSINAASLTPVASITSLFQPGETTVSAVTTDRTTAGGGGKNGAKEDGSGEKSMAAITGMTPGLWVMIMTATLIWRVLIGV